MTEQATGTELHHRRVAVAGVLPFLRRALAAWARRIGLSEDDTQDLTLACHEAMANVVDHAYGSRPGVLEIHATRPDHHVTVTITDHGRWRPRPPTGRDGTRGRGLILIHRLAPVVEVHPGRHGTTVRLCWPLPAAAVV